MDFYMQANAAESAPKLSTLTEKGHFTSGSPELAIPPSTPGAAWFESVTSEIVSAISKLGGTPSRDKIDQLADTLLAKFALKADLESPVLTGDVTVPEPTQDHNPVTKAYLVDLLKRMSNVPTGAVLAIAGAKVPDGFLLCNGATLSRTTYADLFAVIGTLYGKGDGINATSKFGTAVFDGEDGNSIRVTVATNESDASSFDVTTYFKGSLVETQTVKKATELVNNSYITWDTTVALVAGDDVTFTGGTGSTFNLPDMRDRFAEGAGTYSVGTAVEAGLPNIIGTSAYYYCWGAGVVSTGALKDSKMSNKASMVSGHNPEAYELLAIDFNAKNSNQIYHTDSTVQPRSLVFNYIIKY
nr:MAG TPA: tail collar fiber protein [Caudoviricetes sp.]